MKNFLLIGACSNLGINVNGTEEGAKKILTNLKYKSTLLEQDKNIKKDTNNLNKKISLLNDFNSKLYKYILNEKNFCLTIGGDHTVSIASALASLNKYPESGIIWIDAHLDYNTFRTTITNNLHGLPLASLNGLNQELSTFHDGPFYNPKKTVIVGYRAIEENSMFEIENIKLMGVTVFTTNDIKTEGITNIMEKAYKIAGNSIHISFDLDVIDPEISPGVTIKETDGINIEEVDSIINFLKSKINSIKSFDLVEYNHLKDENNKTLNIATNIITKFLK